MRNLYSLFAIVTALLCTANLAAATAQDASTDADGYWINRNGWLIEAGACADGVCGTVIGVGGPYRRRAAI